MRCPGENGCLRWRDAYGKTFEEKARVCRGCEKCDGNPPFQSQDVSETDTEQIVGQVETLRMRQKSGRRFEANELTYLEWELLRVWTAAEEMYEIAHKAKISAIFEAILKMFG